MKKILQALTSFMLIFLLTSSSFSQIGWSISNNYSTNSFTLYQINTNTGVATLAGNVVDSTTLNRTLVNYSGLASINSTLYGVSEYDPSFANPLDRANCALIAPNGRVRIIGQIGNGPSNVLYGIQSGAAYNSTDGFIYGVFGDNIGIQSRLYRISPTTCEGTDLGFIQFLQSGNVFDIFIDGLAFDNAGNLYGSDAFFTDSLYNISIGSCNGQNCQATPNCTLSATSEESGLAFDSVNNRLFILYEGRNPNTPLARLQQITPTGGGFGQQCTLGTLRQLRVGSPSGSLVSTGDFEGFDIPSQPIR